MSASSVVTSANSAGRHQADSRYRNPFLIPWQMVRVAVYHCVRPSSMAHSLLPRYGFPSADETWVSERQRVEGDFINSSACCCPYPLRNSGLTLDIGATTQSFRPIKGLLVCDKRETNLLKTIYYAEKAYTNKDFVCVCFFSAQ